MEQQSKLEILEQEVHDLQSKLKIKNVMEKEMAEELEHLYKTLELRKEEIDEKKSENSLLTAKVMKLEQRLAEEARHFEEFKEDIELKQKEVKEPEKPESDLANYKELIDHLEEANETQKNEINVLMCSAESYKQLIKSERQANQPLVVKVGELESQLAENKELLKSKTDSLEEMKLDCENLVEEKLVMSAELAELKSKPADVHTRGNSLFAEVEDNRKLMAAKLRQVQGKYSVLKQSLLAKNLEIRRLKDQQVFMYRDWHDVNEERQKNDVRLENAHLQRIEDLIREVNKLELRPESPQIVTLSLDNMSQLKWVQEMVEEKRKEADLVRKELQARSLNDWMMQRKLHQATTELLELKKLAIEQKAKNCNCGNTDTKDKSTSPPILQLKPDDNSILKENVVAKAIRFRDKEN